MLSAHILTVPSVEPLSPREGETKEVTVLKTIVNCVTRHTHIRSYNKQQTYLHITLLTTQHLSIYLSSPIRPIPLDLVLSRRKDRVECVFDEFVRAECDGDHRADLEYL